LSSFAGWQYSQKGENTDACAAHEGDDERLQPAGRSDDPYQTNKQQHSKDVLNAREVNTEHCTQLKTQTTSHDSDTYVQFHWAKYPVLDRQADRYSLQQKHKSYEHKRLKTIKNIVDIQKQ